MNKSAGKRGCCPHKHLGIVGLSLCVALGIVGGTAPARAQSTVYTSSASFFAATAPGYYTQNFSNPATNLDASYSFSGNGFGYTVTSGFGNTYQGSGLIATGPDNTTLRVTFTTGNVSAIGGNFFNVNVMDTFQMTPVTITLSDGTTTTFTPSGTSEFRGFTSDNGSAITSLTLSAPGANLYAALDNLTVGAHPQTYLYTSPTSFFSSLEAGYYTESFTQIGTTIANNYSFSSNGFAYTISTGTGVTYRNGNIIGTEGPNTTLRIDFTSGNVNAIGGNFFNVNITDVFQATPVTLTLSDGSTTTFTPSSAADFRGYITSAGTTITSLTLSAPGPDLYAVLDNLTVGRRGATIIVPTAAAPEPGSIVFLLVSGAVAGLAATLSKRIKKESD